MSIIKIIDVAMCLVHSVIPLSGLAMDMFFFYKNGNTLLYALTTWNLANGDHIIAGYKSPGCKISEYIGITAIVAAFAGVFYRNLKNGNQTGNDSLD